MVRQSRQLAALAVAALLSSSFAPLSAHATVGAPGTALSSSAATPVGAMALARRENRVTEVTGLTSDRRLVTADPRSGTFTETLNVGPVRARSGETWVPLDSTLVPSGNRLLPRAASVGLSISSGGTNDLVRLDEGGRSLAFRWPTALPRPVLHGDKAVFGDVRPGIDLVVQARATGFGEFVVVHDRQAAQDPWLKQIPFEIDAPGLAVERDGDRLKAYDGTGDLKFISEPVRMWESAGPLPAGVPTAVSAQVSTAPSGGRSVPVPFRVSGSHLVLSPDRSLLGGADVHYPVVIDPSISGARERFASVTSNGKDGSYATTNKNETPWIGLQPDKNLPDGGLVSRISYGFEVPEDLEDSGVTVLSAKFRHWQVQSTETGTDCLKQTNGPKINVWETHDFSDNFDWDSQPDTVMKMSTSQFVVGDVTKCNAAGYPNKPATQEWDVLAGVLDDIDDKDDVLTLRVNEEFDNNDDPSASVRASGRRWYQNSLDYPALVIQYNSAPLPPTGTTITPASSYQGDTFVASTTPVLTTTVRDPDAGQDLKTTFSLFMPGVEDPITYTATARQPGPAGALVSTADGQVKLVDGQRYVLYASASDGVNGSASGSGPAFVVDATRPGLPAVSGAPTASVAAGTALTFTIDAPEADVASYAYGLNTSTPTTRIVPAALGGAVSVTVSANQFGPNFLAVRSYDRAGNTSSTIQKVAFKVDGATPSNRYRLDGNGLDYRVGAAHGSVAKNLTVPAATTFGVGRYRWADDAGTTTLDCTDRALRVLASTSVRSVVTDPPHPFDTTQAFTISSWLRPELLTGTATGSGDEAYAVSMPVTGTSTAMSLGFRKDPASGQVYWLFTVSGASGRVRVEDPGNRAAALVTANQWAHVSGVFDPVAQTATLYVNGSRVAQLTGVTLTPLKATQLQLGSGPLGSAGLQWNGSVDEVLLYQGVLSATAINQQRADRRSPAAC